MAKFLISAFADEACDELDGQIAALQRNGLHCIEPRSIGGAVIKKSDEEIREIRQKLDEAGITVPSYGSPIGKYDITKEFGPHLEEFHRALEICKMLGTRRMRMFSFFIPEGKLAEYRDEVMRRLSVMLKDAKEAGILLCHENEGGIYGQNPEQVADLLTTLPDLRGVYDPANFVHRGQDAVKGLDATLPSLEYCHIKDCLYKDSVLVPAGAGDGHVKEALQRVDAAFDREIVLTVEPHLFAFQAYKEIDGREQKHLYHFNNSDESFDYAVNALKTMLAEIGHPVTDGRG